MHLAGQTLIIWKSDAAFHGCGGVYDIGVKLLFTKSPRSFFDMLLIQSALQPLLCNIL